MNILIEYTLAEVGITQEVARVIEVAPYGTESFGQVSLFNTSGASRDAGDVVVLDPAADNSFKTTTTIGDTSVVGVLLLDTGIAAQGPIQTSAAKVTINVQGNVARGNYLRTSATAGRAEDAGADWVAGAFAVAMTEYTGGGSGQVEAVLLLASAGIVVPPGFNDAEGDPAAVGTAADGTSGYPARRDHVHAIAAASDTVAGKVELATAAETTTGTDATRAVTPDALAGSNTGKRVVILKIIDDATVLTTGDGKLHFFIPPELNGMNLVDADAAVSTVSSSGVPTIQIANVTDTVDMLSTKITIDANEKTSYTAATAPVIDTTKDDVVTGDHLRIDVDLAGTGAKGLTVMLSFQLP